MMSAKLQLNDEIVNISIVSEARKLHVLIAPRFQYLSLQINEQLLAQRFR